MKRQGLGTMNRKACRNSVNDKIHHQSLQIFHIFILFSLASTLSFCFGTRQRCEFFFYLIPLCTSFCDLLIMRFSFFRITVCEESVKTEQDDEIKKKKLCKNIIFEIVCKVLLLKSLCIKHKH